MTTRSLPRQTTPVSERALAPDLARGGMLLLIALANVHLFVYGHELGVRGYPRGVEGIDRVVVGAQLLLVDGRAYPLFGLLFGYGVVQLSRRAATSGGSVHETVRLVRRRGWWMVAIGFVHALLLFSGDIVGVYGLLAVLMAGLLVRGPDRRLVAVGVGGVAVLTLVYAGSGLNLPGEAEAFLPSMAVDQPVEAAMLRLGEWAVLSLGLQAIGVFGAVALGAWAARRRFLEEPHRHRGLLRRTAVLGLSGAVLGGLPLALLGAGVWTSPPLAAVLAAGSLHALGGYAGGLGYLAVFGLLGIRAAARPAGGPGRRALLACGRRSLSCYLLQSVVFAALSPAWALGLGADLRLWQTALLAVLTWALGLAVAAWLEGRGSRGPAEVLLRRMMYAGTSRAGADR